MKYIKRVLQTKIFKGHDTELLEKSINEFCLEHDVKDVIFSGVTGGIQTSPMYCYTVIYSIEIYKNT